MSSGPTLENKDDRASEAPVESTGSSEGNDRCRPVPTTHGTEPTEADLERRIIAAELEGRKTVADLLAKRLDAHRAARTGDNIVHLAGRRGRGGR